MKLRDQLRTVPEPVRLPEPNGEVIAACVRYLGSDDAIRSVEVDTYWPKWDSPWWHMLLLYELGEAQRIPARVVDAMVDGLNALPLHIFPIHPGDAPPGTAPDRHSSCHCALGCIYRVLAACGVDVDRDLPWITSWFPRYQMADGGLNCDEAAYLVTGECPSSMVATIAPFEAMTLGTPAQWNAERTGFVDDVARFLIERELRLGSATVHNAEERASAQSWAQLCFPRFYFYDVLRGLAALARWAVATSKPIPRRAIAGVVDGMVAAFPDGVVHLGRQGYAGVGTRIRDGSGAWVRGSVATRFALLDATSVIGAPCPSLTGQWRATRRALAALDANGLIA